MQIRDTINFLPVQNSTKNQSAIIDKQYTSQFLSQFTIDSAFVEQGAQYVPSFSEMLYGNNGSNQQPTNPYMTYQQEEHGEDSYKYDNNEIEVNSTQTNNEKSIEKEDSYNIEEKQVNSETQQETESNAVTDENEATRIAADNANTEDAEIPEENTITAENKLLSDSEKDKLNQDISKIVQTETLEHSEKKSVEKTADNTTASKGDDKHLLNPVGKEQGAEQSSKQQHRNQQAERNKENAEELLQNNKIGEIQKQSTNQQQAGSDMLRRQSENTEEAVLRISTKFPKESLLRNDLGFSMTQQGIGNSGNTIQNTQSFSQLFKAQISNQLIKQASILLNNQSTGEVRMILEPKELGEVRIRMQFENNTVLGKIMVDNQLVRSVVEQNLDSIQRGLAQQGLEIGSLEVSVREDFQNEFMKEDIQAQSDAYERASNNILPTATHIWIDGEAVNMVA